MINLSKNFKLEQYTFSATAKNNGIENTPSKKHIEKLKELHNTIILPLIEKFGNALFLTSGFRSIELNKKIGGSENSQHCKGEAADLYLKIDGLNFNEVLFEYIQKNLHFGQLIWEKGNDKKPSWVHVSLPTKNNKMQVIKKI